MKKLRDKNKGRIHNNKVNYKMIESKVYYYYKKRTFESHAVS